MYFITFQYQYINSPLLIDKWDLFTRNGKLPNEFVHNTGSVNIFTGYLGLFTKIHENMTKFTENFQNQTEELKETKRVFNTLHNIDREYFILHTSHPKIMMFDWKTRFGVEPIDMFNYKATITAPAPKFFTYSFLYYQNVLIPQIDLKINYHKR